MSIYPMNVFKDLSAKRQGNVGELACALTCMCMLGNKADFELASERKPFDFYLDYDDMTFKVQVKCTFDVNKYERDNHGRDGRYSYRLKKKASKLGKDVAYRPGEFDILACGLMVPNKIAFYFLHTKELINPKTGGMQQNITFQMKHFEQSRESLFRALSYGNK